MIYTAECRICIRTDNKVEFDNFVKEVHKNYGELTSDKIPDDLDITFEFNIHKEVESEYDDLVDDSDEE